MSIRQQLASAGRRVASGRFLRLVRQRWARTWTYATGVLVLATLSGEGLSARLLLGAVGATLALALIGALVASKRRGHDELDHPMPRAPVRGWRAAFTFADSPEWKRFPRRTRNAVALVVLLLGLAPVLMAALWASFEPRTLLWFSMPPLLVWVRLTEWRTERL